MNAAAAQDRYDCLILCCGSVAPLGLNNLMSTTTVMRRACVDYDAKRNGFKQGSYRLSGW
jgi:hypothetical protein